MGTLDYSNLIGMTLGAMYDSSSWEDFASLLASIESQASAAVLAPRLQPFWKPTIAGYEWTSVALGCLDTPFAQKIAKHTFVADKGHYYDITDGAPQKEAF